MKETEDFDMKRVCFQVTWALLLALALLCCVGWGCASDPAQGEGDEVNNTNNDNNGDDDGTADDDDDNDDDNDDDDDDSGDDDSGDDDDDDDDDSGDDDDDDDDDSGDDDDDDDDDTTPPGCIVKRVGDNIWMQKDEISGAPVAVFGCDDPQKMCDLVEGMMNPETINGVEWWWTKVPNSQVDSLRVATGKSGDHYLGWYNFAACDMTSEPPAVAPHWFETVAGGFIDLTPTLFRCLYGELDFTVVPEISVPGQSVQFASVAPKNPDPLCSAVNFTYYWDFGDTGDSTLPNPTHTYTTANTYLVVLKVWDQGVKYQKAKTHLVSVESPCVTDADCPSNGHWCDGWEYCDQQTHFCAHSGEESRCPDANNSFCEGRNLCAEVGTGGYCYNEFSPTSPRCPNNGLACDGEEWCSDEFMACASTGNPCGEDECTEVPPDSFECVPVGDDDDDDDTTPPEPYCGDGNCDLAEGETPLGCPQDCFDRCEVSYDEIENIMFLYAGMYTGDIQYFVEGCVGDGNICELLYAEEPELQHSGKTWWLEVPEVPGGVYNWFNAIKEDDTWFPVSQCVTTNVIFVDDGYGGFILFPAP
jgi:PKD repeat protein